MILEWSGNSSCLPAGRLGVIFTLHWLKSGMYSFASFNLQTCTTWNYCSHFAHPYLDCDWLGFWPTAKKPSWEFGISSQKTKTMSSDSISAWLSTSNLSESKTPRRPETDAARCLFPFFPRLTFSLEVSGVESSCHQGQGVKISVWFRFPEKRIQLEENQKVVRPSKPPLLLENVLQGLHHCVVCATFQA